MHCKIEAINQVSLKCFIKFDGLSPGKSTVLIQISFKVRLCSSRSKGIAQQSLILAFLSDTVISGPCVEMITLLSIYSPCTMINIVCSILLGRYPLVTSLFFATENPNILLKGRCRFISKVTKTPIDKFKHMFVASSARIKRRF